MMDKATVKLGFAYCLALQVAFTSLFPCACLWAGYSGSNGNTVTAAEAQAEASGNPVCWCSLRQVAPLPTREVHLPSILSHAFMVPFLLSTAQPETHPPFSLCASMCDVTASPDIHEIQVLRE